MLPLAMFGTIVIFRHPENRSVPDKLAKEKPAEPVATNSSAAVEAKPRPIEVVLPDERYRDTAFLFKAPAWESMAASANRLLKFEFPPIRGPKVYERLIKTHVLSAGLSKKVLETLPLPFLETIYRELWQSCVGLGDSTASQWLTLFLLTEELQEFNGAQLVAQDINQIGLRDTGTLHSYYYREHLSRDDMTAFLTGHGYRTDFLSQLETNDESLVHLAYLACRRLSAPLPWQELLNTLHTEDELKYTRLARLKAIHALLKNQSWAKQPVTPANLATGVEKIRKLMTGKAFSAIASAYTIPRPVQELVIVEGETEKMLLPLFAEAMDIDFNALGIDILPAGGKNHVTALYREFARILNAPICIVLDSDAAEIAQELESTLRPQDHVFQIAEGEFEDLYDLELTLKAINQHYQPYPEVTRRGFQDIANDSNARGRVQALKAIWQAYNLGSFDKIEFAGHYAELLKPSAEPEQRIQPPPAIRKLLGTILNVRGGLRSGKG